MDKVPVTWGEVLQYMRLHYRETILSQRMGQAYFNALKSIYPEVAEIVRESDADPFYADDPKDPRMVKFFDVIIPYFA